MGHAFANYFSKAYIVSYRKNAKKEQIHRFISWQNPLKLKKLPQKDHAISIPYLLQAQSAIVQ